MGNSSNSTNNVNVLNGSAYISIDNSTNSTISLNISNGTASIRFPSNSSKPTFVLNNGTYLIKTPSSPNTTILFTPTNSSSSPSIQFKNSTLEISPKSPTSSISPEDVVVSGVQPASVPSTYGLNPLSNTNSYSIIDSASYLLGNGSYISYYIP